MKKKVVIDTDPGIDDSLALMLAGKSKDLDLLGVTVTAGNVDVHKGTQNALDVLHLIDRDDVKVYKGSEKPLKKEPVFAEDTHGSNGIGEIVLSPSPNQSHGNAVQFLRDTLDKNEDITIIALGPLTNLAELIIKYPESAKKIKQLVLMGGTYKSHGNCSPVAEFNFWFDPDAAKIVFEKLKCPITMTGLDVTRKILLTPNYREFIKRLGEPIGKTIYDMTRFYTDFHWKQEGVLGCVINDPLAVAQVIDSSICSGFESYVQVIPDGPTEGMSMVDVQGILNKENNCYVLVECDQKKFFKLFLKTLFEDKEDLINSIIDNTTYGN